MKGQISVRVFACLLLGGLAIYSSSVKAATATLTGPASASAGTIATYTNKVTLSDLGSTWDFCQFHLIDPAGNDNIVSAPSVSVAGPTGNPAPFTQLVIIWQGPGNWTLNAHDGGWQGVDHSESGTSSPSR